MDTPSGQQLRAFQDHAHAFWADPHLRAALEAEDEASLCRPTGPVAGSWRGSGSSYFHRFGGRFPNELRLEDASPLDDFSLLAQSLRALAAQTQQSRALSRLRKQVFRGGFENSANLFNNGKACGCFAPRRLGGCEKSSLNRATAMQNSGIFWPRKMCFGSK